MGNAWTMCLAQVHYDVYKQSFLGDETIQGCTKDYLYTKPKVMSWNGLINSPKLKHIQFIIRYTKAENSYSWNKKTEIENE